MATEERLETQTFPVNSDLSTHQYKFVALASDGEIVLNVTAGADCIGILQDKPAAAGRAACVATGGRSKLIMGATIVPGMSVTSNNAGLGVEATSGEMSMGTCIEGATNGLIGSIIIDKQALVG